MDDYEYEEIQQQMSAAYRDTEREIFASATGAEDPYEVDAGKAEREELYQSEGMNGLPLSDAEQIESTRRGGLYQERPLQTEWEAENEMLRQEIAARDQQQAVAAQWTPEQIAAARQSWEDNFYNRYGAVFVDEPHKKEQLMNELWAAHQQTQGLQMALRQRHDADVNRSIADAIDEGGEPVARALDDLTYSDPNDPVAVALKHRVFSAGDRAGAVLSSYVGNSLVHTSRHPNAPPFMGQQYRDAQRQYRQATGKHNAAARAYTDEVDAGGWGNADVEANIFDFASQRQEEW